MTVARSLGAFAAVSAAIIIAAMLGLRMFFTGAAERQAMLLSAGLAFAVQVGAFALVAAAKKTAVAAPGELIMRWGMGAVIRLLVLMMFAGLAAVMKLPLDAALVSLATYFFLTMMAEPVLLNHVR